MPETPPEEAFVKWHETLGWLSYHDGNIACFNCPRCGVRKRYNVSSILKSAGDVAVASLPSIVARAINCARVDNTGRDLCRMRQDPAEPWLKKGPPADQFVRQMASLGKGMSILGDIDLYEIDRWQILHGVCRCGHRQVIDKEKLALRYPGSTRMRELAEKLQCRRCGNSNGNFFAFTMMERG